MIGKALNRKIVAAILDQLHNCVVERILVLLQPAGQVIRDGGGVVDDGKVRVRVGGSASQTESTCPASWSSASQQRWRRWPWGKETPPQRWRGRPWASQTCQCTSADPCQSQRWPSPNPRGRTFLAQG